MGRFITLPAGFTFNLNGGVLDAEIIMQQRFYFVQDACG
jgi:hypothetical protein